MNAAPAREDHYPSRTVAEPRLLPRRDPVLHGGSDAPGPLRRDELLDYERDGWLLCRGLFSATEVADVQAEVLRLRQADEAARIIEPDSAAVRSLFAVHRGAGLLARLTADPRLAGRAQQILGGPVGIHQSRVNLKPGFDGREFWWHSDFETWHVEDGLPAMRVLSVMVMLTRNHAASGPLLVIPGSHTTFVSCVGATPADHHATSLRRQEYGLPDRDSITALVRQRPVEAVLGEPGDVVLFDGNLLHGSGSNLAPDERCNVFAVYNAVANAALAPFSGQAPRPAHVAERVLTPIALSEGSCA
jgi:ectoine hydroxylase